MPYHYWHHTTKKWLQCISRNKYYRSFEALNVIKMDHVTLLVLEGNGHGGTVTAEGYVIGTAGKTNSRVDEKVIQHRLTCFANALRSFVDVGHSDYLESYVANNTLRCIY